MIATLVQILSKPLLFNNGLKTIDILLRYGINCQSSCILCSSASKSNQHFMHCTFIASVWNLLCSKFMFHDSDPDIPSQAKRLISSRHSPLENLAASLSLPALVWHCWKERNLRIFKNSYRCAIRIFYCIASDIKSRIFFDLKSRIFFLLNNRYLSEIDGNFASLWDLPPHTSSQTPPPRTSLRTILSNFCSTLTFGCFQIEERFILGCLLCNILGLVLGSCAFPSTSLCCTTFFLLTCQQILCYCLR